MSTIAHVKGRRVKVIKHFPNGRSAVATLTPRTHPIQYQVRTEDIDYRR